jgi:hypothetical protein
MGGRAVEGAPAAKAAKRQSREGGKKTKPRRRRKIKIACALALRNGWVAERSKAPPPRRRQKDKAAKAAKRQSREGGER